MEQLSKVLVDILTRQNELHDRLLVVVAQMNTALMMKQVPEVQRTMGDYDELVFQVDGLEEQRLAVCDKFASVSGSGRRHMTLAQIIEIAPAAYRQPLADLRAQLKAKIGALSDNNTSNRILLEERLHEISSTFEIVTRMESKYQGYQKQGAKDSRTYNRALLNRVA
jgi:flagellar biosynthesis/type III secretory pathway chaperone